MKGFQLDTVQLLYFFWYRLIQFKLHIIIKKNTYLYHNMGRVVHGRCLISPSWAPLGGLDLWLQLIYALAWENQPQQISLSIFKGLLLFSFSCQQNSIYMVCLFALIRNDWQCSSYILFKMMIMCYRCYILSNNSPYIFRCTTDTYEYSPLGRLIAYNTPYTEWHV